MSANLNDEVEITLTKYGKQIWKDYLQSITNSLCNYRSENIYKICNDIYKTIENISVSVIYNYKLTIRCQLWEVFEVFGEHISHGQDIPFEHNEIKFSKNSF